MYDERDERDIERNGKKGRENSKSLFICSDIYINASWAKLYDTFVGGHKLAAELKKHESNSKRI